jgi:hypothetical protein
MNKSDKIDFKNDEPKKCAVPDCKNKPCAKNKLTPDVYEWVCQKHNLEFNYGVVR